MLILKLRKAAMGNWVLELWIINLNSLFKKKTDEFVKNNSQPDQPVQRQVSLGLLENKRDQWVQSGPAKDFNETVDNDTQPNSSAHLVGRYWIEAGGERIEEKPYGATALDFQYLGHTGKRSYRPPMIKQSGQAKGAVQANYEEKYMGYKFNAHVTLTGEKSNRKEIEAAERAEYEGIEKNLDPKSVAKPKWYEL